MKRSYTWVAGTIIGAGAFLGAVAPDLVERHERKEVGGLSILFGAEPEPAVHDEMQFLRWRVTNVADDQPYASLTDAEVRITREGEEFGPFELSPVRSTPGQYETRHIFTEPGDYGSVLSFKKGEDPTVHTVDFAFSINDRAMLELPPRGR